MAVSIASNKGFISICSLIRSARSVSAQRLLPANNIAWWTQTASPCTTRRTFSTTTAIAQQQQQQRQQHLHPDELSSLPSPSTIPSLTASNSTVLVQHGQKTKNARKPTTRKHVRWTEEETLSLQDHVRQGKTTPDIHHLFPNRTISAIDFHVAGVRSAMINEELDKQEALLREQEGEGRDQSTETVLTTQERAEIVNRLRPKLKPWTEQEDNILRDLVEIYGAQSRWNELENHLVDGKTRLGRTSTSCRRRWEIINPVSERKRGHWQDHEHALLFKSLNAQLAGAMDDGVKDKDKNNGNKTVKSTIYSRADVARLRQQNLEDISWNEVSKVVGSRTSSQCRSRVFKCILSGDRGSWTDRELHLLHEGFREYGTDWIKIAAKIGTRSASQVQNTHWRMTRPNTNAE
ncbi:hypothetical protein BGZ83_003149 [Gryganskiella cystojenkinii]|nr:hypothetical protein BGZ83_003149 [Gryganskiella cystojenkinii]